MLRLLFSIMLLHALVLTAVPPASAAGAGFRGLQWGMTPQEVLVASRGTAQLDPNRGRYSTPQAFAMFVVPHRFAGFPFEARFLFDRETRGLSRLHLTLLDPEACGDLREALGGRYGQPQNEVQSLYFSFTKWYDRGRDEVVWSDIAGQCTLESWPLPPPIPPDP